MTRSKMPNRELLARDIPGYIKELEMEKEHILDAIRKHRSTKTPMMWDQHDEELYEQLPEVKNSEAN